MPILADPAAAGDGARRFKLALVLACAAPLLARGCTDARGRIDPARSTLLGLGAGAATFGLGSLILRDQQIRRPYGHGGGYGFGNRFGGYGQGSYLPPVAQPYGGHGYGRGYGW